MPPHRRRQLIADLLFHKFDHLDADDVTGLVTWALNFSELPDDYLINRWNRIYDCP